MNLDANHEQPLFSQIVINCSALLIHPSKNHILETCGNSGIPVQTNKEPLHTWCYNMTTVFPMGQPVQLTCVLLMVRTPVIHEQTTYVRR